MLPDHTPTHHTNIQCHNTIIHSQTTSNRNRYGGNTSNDTPPVDSPRTVATTYMPFNCNNTPTPRQATESRHRHANPTVHSIITHKNTLLEQLAECNRGRWLRWYLQCTRAFGFRRRQRLCCFALFYLVNYLAFFYWLGCWLWDWLGFRHNHW